MQDNKVYAGIFPASKLYYVPITFGWGNGYVLIQDPTNSFYDKDYYEIEIPIEGALTYSNFLTPRKFIESGGELLDEIPEQDLDKEFWVLGFDTGHAGDTIETWPKEKVIKVTLDLKNIIKNEKRN